jgi:hypothetical protein
MSGNHNTANLARYGGDVREAIHTFDLFGVRVHWEHLVSAIPQFLEHGVGGNVRVPRDARNSKAISLKEPCN